MRALVCDDDATVREFLRALFEADGWEIDTVESGEQCLADLELHPDLDALVLDQVMPGLQGLQVANKLRKGGFDRPIILCSAFLGPKLQKDIKRLKVITVNKIDAQAVIRHARAAVHEFERAERLARAR